jgi:antigen flippase
LSQDDKKSYGQILKSSVTIGGSSVLNLGISMVRNKVFALLLGQGGIGLVGVFTSLLELSRSVATMGMNTSGVRQIAEAAADSNPERVARTALTLQRLALVLGLGGALALAACSPLLGRLTFPEEPGHRVGEIVLLGAAVLLWSVSVGQIALVQGMRRIRDLAQVSVVGALLATLASIPIIYFWRERGIVPSLICVAGMSLLASWWYSRKIQVSPVTLSFSAWRAESAGLLKLGVVFMLSGLLTLGAAYLVRVMVLRKLGEEAAGNYHAAWALGGMYVGFILQAMGADFLPRLTAVVKDNRESTRLVNEQTEVSLLLAGPGIVATLALAPLVVWLLYTAEFQPAIEVLRWVCLGMMLRVASWPMAFIMTARGERLLFFATELGINVVLIGLTWVGMRWFGLRGTGMAFFGMYAVYWVLIYFVMRSLTGFRWSAANRKTGSIWLIVLTVVFALPYALPEIPAMIIGLLMAFAAGVYSLRRVLNLLPPERVPRAVVKVARLLRLVPEAIPGS